jgi:hypothetical protein
MKQCPQCNRPIRQGDSVAVLALSINCTKDDAVYDLISDFFDKEMVLHSGCLKAYVDRLPLEDNGNLGKVAAATHPMPLGTNMLATRITTILRELGDNSPRVDIMRFVVENKNLGHAEMLRKWFQERSTL